MDLIRVAARVAALPRRITDPDELEEHFYEVNGGPPLVVEEIERYLDLHVRPADKAWVEKQLTEWCLSTAP